VALFAKMEKSAADQCIVKDPATQKRSSRITTTMQRPCFSDEYLRLQPRQCPIGDTAGKGIERITPVGAVVAGKEYALDFLVYARFRMAQRFAARLAFEIHGRDSLASRSGELGHSNHAISRRGFEANLACEFAGIRNRGIDKQFKRILFARRLRQQA